MKLYTPFAHAKNIFEIPLDFYKKYNIKYIFCDLDNTLDAFDQAVPTEKVYEFKRNLENEGIELIVISNNSKKRVEKYSNELGCRYIYRSGKPFIGKTKRFVKENNINLNEVIAVGDQVFTDVVYANKLKILNILCDNLVNRDQKVTQFNKFFDKNIRKKLIKKGEMIDWRER